MILAGQLLLESIPEILHLHHCLLVVVLTMEQQQISKIVSSAQHELQKMNTILVVLLNIQPQKDNQLDTVSCFAQNMNQ